MAETPLSFLISRSKWSKVCLLIKEIIMSVQYQARNLIGFDTDVVQVNSPVYRSDGSVEEGVPTTKKSSSVWGYESKVAISPEVLSRATIQYEQDTTIDSGEVQTNFVYHMAEILNASMSTNGVTHVSIYGADEQRLPEYSYIKYGRNRARATSKTRRLPVDGFIPGITLNLYGNVENTAGNYGHWMIDGVAMLYLALREYSIDEIDHFLVPVLLHDFQKESLVAMGIAEHKIVELPTLSCYRFERLICASAPRARSSCVTPGWLIDAYRQALPAMKSTAAAKRRLYISRRDANSRKFVNEDEIVQLMESLDFDVIELSKFDFLEKIELFVNAEIIVGLTGAGFTNVMFCSKNAHVIEIFPTSFITYFYASMAGYLGLGYQPLIFENHSLISGVNKYYGNLSLDPNLLRNALKDIL